jgi:hypothetical protein
VSVLNYYNNPVPTTVVYEETGYRSRPGSTGTRFHHTKEGPLVVVIGVPLSMVIEQPEAAAAPPFPVLSWQGWQPMMVDFQKPAMIPSGPMPGSSS